MILRCNYEELSALRHGARALLDHGDEEHHPVAAPPEAHATVAALLPRLVGDLTIDTLHELRSVQMAVEAIVVCLRSEMQTAVAATHPADEGAVSAYFEFAHAYSVSERLREAADEMEALIELLTGGPATPEVAREFVFPD
jgi:hypothetical protein